MKHILIVILALLTCCPAWGQKELKSVRRLLKDNKPNEAMKEISRLEADTTLKSELLPRLFDLGKEAQLRLNAMENEKIYLKKNPDTTALFRTTLNICNFVLKCDSAETALGDTKHKCRKKNAEILTNFHSNLRAAGHWHFVKQNYDDARRYLRAYINIPSAPMWSGESMDTLKYANAGYLVLKSSFELGDYAAVDEYKELALADTMRRATVWECLAKSARERGDSVAFREYLEAGVRDCPEVPYFFTYLSDYYNYRQQYENSFELADTLLRKMPKNAVFLAGKALAEMNLKRYDDCIKTCDTLVAIDSTAAGAYYARGASYCNLATEVKIPADINTKAYKVAKEKQKALYTQARPDIETYRKLKPEDRQKWAPLLYRIYLNLNMGRQFEEVERVLMTL